MKKYIIATAILVALVNCKKEEKQIVVGINESGESLTINEKGDTVVIAKETVTNTTKNTEEPKNVIVEPKAFTKVENGSYTFNYNLEKGKTYPFNISISQTQSLTDGKQTMKMSNARTTNMDYLVEDVTNGTFKLKSTFKGFSEKFTSPDNETLSYTTDGAKPTDADVAKSWQVYKAIVGQSFNINIDSKGNVLNVTGLDKVITAVEAKLKSSFNTEEQKMLKEILKGTINSEVIKAQFEETLKLFPEKNLKIGEDWNDKQNINEGKITGTSNVKRTLTEVDDTKGVITVSGTQNVSGSDTKDKVTMKLKNNSTVKGTVTLDAKSGWITKASLTKSETVKQTYSAEGQSQTNTQTTTIKTTVN